MKKRTTLFGILFLVVMAVTFTAFKQKEKDKQNQKEQKQNQAKNQDKPGKGNNGRNGNEQGEGKMEKENKGNNDNDNKNNDDRSGNNGKNDDKNHPDHGNNDGKDGYSWDRESFKERNKIRNKDKVTLCHKFNNGDEPAVTLRVSSNALKAHMNHGDVMGDCPAATNSRYSDVFLRNRTEYYNSIQNTEEQIVYSRSILDYALERLTTSRVQLSTLQRNNMPAADIQRKEATVVELEQNVSLLETLIGVTANIVANKL